LPEFYFHRTDDGTFGKIPRFLVPDNEVSWSADFPLYKPAEFTAPFVPKAAWADPELGSAGFKPQWNTLDGKVKRVSHGGDYQIDKNSNRPLNSMDAGVQIMPLIR